MNGLRGFLSSPARGSGEGFLQHPLSEASAQRALTDQVDVDAEKRFEVRQKSPLIEQTALRGELYEKVDVAVPLGLAPRHGAEHADVARAPAVRQPQDVWESLLERRCYDPAINAAFFPNTPPFWFWSSCPHAYYSYYAWLVEFGYGGVGYGYGYEVYFAFHVRVVRAGQ